MNHDLIERNETNKNSKGGTELLQDRLYDGLVPRELLEQFQIVFSRVRDLDENRFRIYYAHDLAGDPESNNALGDGGWNRFHKIVFVSNWQLQQYISAYNIPWSHCTVIENSIRPIDLKLQMDYQENLRICYTSTPHRGLNILFAAFDALSKKRSNIHLDVFSSFKLYGWDQRDEQFKDLFEKIEAHPNATNHGTKSNEEIRDYLAQQGDIFVHPGTWPETSCLCLIEAMSAGLMCIHSNYAALPDTSGGMTFMYQFSEDENMHATKLYHILDGAVENFAEDSVSAKRKLTKVYADTRFNWFNKANEWASLLAQLVAQNPDKKLPGKYFSYNVG